MSQPEHTLTNADILVINAALQAFEQPVPKIVDGKEQKQPYDLGDKARYAIIRNLKRLKSIVDNINEARDALRVVYNPGNLRSLPDDKQAAWDTEHAKLMKSHAEPVQFHTVQLSEFNLTKNTTLPHSIISILLGYVIEDNGPQDGVPTPEPKA